MMRRPTPLATIALLTGALFVSFAPASSAKALAAAADSTEGWGRVSAEQDSAESAGGWLPIPEEDLESAEALEAERAAARSGALLRGGIARGRFRVRRIGLVGERAGFRTELGFLAVSKGMAPGGRVSVRSGTVMLAAGRVSVTRAAPLFSEALGIARIGRRVPSPRSGVVTAAPSLGASAGAIDGGAIVWRGAASIWSFAGTRGAAREPVGGGGLEIARGGTRVSAAAGAVGRALRCGSVTVRRRSRGRSVSAEALSSNQGRAFLAEIVGRAEAMLLSARWRYRTWTERRVSAEISAETLGSGSRARLTWRSWAGNAAKDDGVLEVEASAGRTGPGPAPMRVRLGAAGLGRDGDRAVSREAYGILDAALVRDASRSLGVHVVRRASVNAGSRASSTTVGTRLDVRAGWMGEHSILIESTSVQSGVSAWGVELTPSGETTLRARSKPGMWVAARGGFGAHHWRLGYALERGEDAEGPRPWSGTVWLRLDR